MIARGFKPVGWVAAVATAAIGCYMLSLQVAAERAELASVERKIVAVQQNIRALQTELGTRGRLSQLEHWNAEVLALSAPAASQFLDSELRLARFDVREPDPLEGVQVRMASAELPSVAASPGTPAGSPVPALREAVAKLPDQNASASPSVRRASLVVGVEPEAGLAGTPGVVEASTPLIKAETLEDLNSAARSEREGGVGD